jgi:hypothetical protein
MKVIDQSFFEIPMSDSLDNFNVHQIRSSINRYFLRNKWAHRKHFVNNELYTDVLSSFLLDLFVPKKENMDSHHYVVKGASYFYSLDHLNRVYFENEEFRKTISDIWSSLLNSEK